MQELDVTGTLTRQAAGRSDLLIDRVGACDDFDRSRNHETRNDSPG